MSEPFSETGARRAVLPPTSSIGTTTAGSVPAWRRIAGMPSLIFLALFAVVMIAGITGTLPDSMLAGFAVTLVFGGLLSWIGNLVPGVRDFGLPTVLCTFAPALIAFAGFMSENFTAVVASFVDAQGFLDFFVVAIIVGSVLGMPRALLMKAGPRFVVPLLGCLAATFLIVGGLGAVMGFGFLEAILFIAAPIMAGGLGLGAVPMADMYAQRMGGASGDFMGDLMSAVVLANIVCILIAGIYNGLGRRRQLFAGFNGNGQLLRIEGRRDELSMLPKLDSAAFSSLGVGLAIASVLYVLGQVLGVFLPALHPYAWTIIAAVLVKLLGLFPQQLEEAATAWGDLVGAFLVPALLVGVSLTFIDIGEVIASLGNPAFIPLTIVTVVVSTLTSGALGWLVKMNFIEASITPGLVMADTGGSGDVAVLSAAGRMHLMPFAALTNRVGGVLVLFVTSLLATLL